MSEIGEGFAQGSQGPGAQSLGAVKRLTRAGMGRCQGRYCGPVLAAMSADQENVLGEAAFWAPRPPIKPIAIADIVAGTPQD